MFETDDINLAAFLELHYYSCQLCPRVHANSGGHRYTFVFDGEIPQHLKDEWLSGQAIAPVNRVIQSYRHLQYRIAEKRRQERDLPPGAKPVEPTEPMGLAE